MSIVLNPRLLKDIEQLSTAAQTSCLESFHSLIIQFAPKSTAYTPSVMRARCSGVNNFLFVKLLSQFVLQRAVCFRSHHCCRTQLAILHHNENVSREQATDASGNPRFHKKLPKSSKGREVLCPIKTKATHGKLVWCIFLSAIPCVLESEATNC